MARNGVKHTMIRSERVHACGISHPGRQRSANEDSILLDEAGSFVLLADGMGGHERGGEASCTAVEVIRRHLGPDAMAAKLQSITENAGLPPAVVCLLSSVDAAVADANTALYNRNLQERVQRFMGTTIVGLAVVPGDFAVWFHVGDSRIYRWRDDGLACLTVDHSVHAQWERDGRVGVEPPKNIITRAIGPNPTVKADTGWESMLGKDLYLLCSDGLTDMLSEVQIGAIFRQDRDLEKIANRLVDEANAAGGKDNISVIVCSAR